MTCDFETTKLADGQYRHVCHLCGRDEITTTERWVIRCGPSRGLGDTVAKTAKRLGIKRCRGCKKRQPALNNFWPYKTR